MCVVYFSVIDFWHAGLNSLVCMLMFSHASFVFLHILHPFRSVCMTLGRGNLLLYTPNTYKSNIRKRILYLKKNIYNNINGRPRHIHSPFRERIFCFFFLVGGTTCIDCTSLGFGIVDVALSTQGKSMAGAQLVKTEATSRVFCGYT